MGTVGTVGKAACFQGKNGHAYEDALLSLSYVLDAGHLYKMIDPCRAFS